MSVFSFRLFIFTFDKSLFIISSTVYLPEAVSWSLEEMWLMYTLLLHVLKLFAQPLLECGFIIKHTNNGMFLFHIHTFKVVSKHRAFVQLSQRMKSKWTMNIYSRNFTTWNRTVLPVVVQVYKCLREKKKRKKKLCSSSIPQSLPER